MSPTFLGSPRVCLWSLLGVLLVGSVAFLLVGLGRRDAGETRPGEFAVEIRDPDGRPATTAEVYVEMPASSAAEPVGRWSARRATLTLPPAPPEGHTIYVHGRGLRSERIEGVREAQVLRLRRGFVARLHVDGDPLPSDDPLRLVFRIRPAPDPRSAVSPDEREKLVDLMDLVSPPMGREPDLPRRTFGFAVADTVAARGILLPVAGRFVVRWGLFDPAADLWFSLEEEAEAYIGVEDDPRPQTFDIPVPRNALDRTRLGLERRIESRRGR